MLKKVDGTTVSLSEAIITTPKQPESSTAICEKDLTILSECQSIAQANVGMALIQLKAKLDFEEQLNTTKNFLNSKESNIREKRNRLLKEGLSYEQAVLYWTLKRRGEIKKFPDGFWRARQTAQNFFFVTLDSIPEFKEAREKNNIKTMTALYRKHVIEYQATSHPVNGQIAFFYEVGGMRGFMTGKISYLKKNGSAAELIKSFLPQLIDIRNPDALNPLEVEHKYWNDPDNAKYHTILALDSIEGFKEARELNDIKKMAELYRKHVKNYKTRNKEKVRFDGQLAFFYEVGGLNGLVTRERDYLKKKGNVRSILDLALPGLVNEKDPDALRLREVEKGHLNDPQMAKKYILEGLNTISGFKEAKESNNIKKMAELYRKHVIGYKLKDKKKCLWNGQLAFFYEHCNLVSLVCNSRDFFERSGSPYSVIKFVLPELIDIKNPDALDPLELIRNPIKGTTPTISSKILDAVDKIPGFTNARTNNNFKEMFDLFSEHVMRYEPQKGRAKSELAFLYEVADIENLIDPILEEDETIDPLHFFKIAMPDFIQYYVNETYLLAEKTKPLLYSLAKKYSATSGLPYDVLLDAGTESLERAAKKFNPTLGIKFSTYASNSILNGFRQIRKSNTTSLEESFSSNKKDGDGISLRDTITYSDDESVVELTGELNLKSIVDSILNDDDLDERERKIIRLRFGFDDEDEMSLREIAEKFEISKERIRQLESRAKEKIRAKLEGLGINADLFID